MNSCLTYTTKYFFSLRATRHSDLESVTKSILELGREYALGLISRSMFVGEGVTYHPRDEVLTSLQVPTGDWETVRHMKALVKCVNNMTIQRFRLLAN